jgi:hypothetical protein
MYHVLFWRGFCSIHLLAQFVFNWGVRKFSRVISTLALSCVRLAFCPEATTSSKNAPYGAMLYHYTILVYV